MLEARTVELIGKYVAIVGALVTAVLAVAQFQRSVSQSIREFEWKQAEQARTMINAMLNDEGWDAMTMLDWEEGRTYEIAPRQRVRILPSDVAPALQASISSKGRKRTEKQRFIGDRYDRLFFLVSQLQVAIRPGLVRRDDVQFPLAWYAEKRLCAHKPLLLGYMAENSAVETDSFLIPLKPGSDALLARSQWEGADAAVPERAAEPRSAPARGSRCSPPLVTASVRRHGATEGG